MIKVHHDQNDSHENINPVYSQCAAALNAETWSLTLLPLSGGSGGGVGGGGGICRGLE